ncbi:MAG: bifunctional hydroxymethylpyrimidine kinase/phosphomethylpyrimidine kinase [Undibacterium sp.]|nr:bifunctional hydroxymethylpyrimidine kinase/phosphomethylpyrimidine kinase [Opitutaceae bacterium]
MSPAVLCFGEILWDLLPHGAFPGGAPFNVAYHLHRLGVPVLPVSAVGPDELGAQLLRRLEAWGIATTAITRDPTAPTGRVTATLSASGDAHYTIETHVAWDHISIDGAALATAARAPALVFGSLALRSAHNRQALARSADNRQPLARLAAALPPTAWRVFDVNLRAPHDDLALVRRFAPLANVLKLNSAEAARLVSDAPESPGREETDARALAAQLGVSTVCVTAGSRGAGLLRADRWTWVPAQPVAVVDTIGAGDAFLAALLAGLLRGARTDAELLSAACRLGEWVAAHAGATPAYDGTTPV